MAQLYGKFRVRISRRKLTLISIDFRQALSRTSENKPKIELTKQTWSDTPFIIRGTDEGVPAWHYILVPFNKLLDLKNQQIGASFDCTKFDSIIKYRDDQGLPFPMSGWGRDPPITLQTWFDEH